MSAHGNANEAGSGLPRFETSIPGLDRVLCGGFLQGGVYILQGPPGAGKTTLANQICFHHAKRGGHALYVTMLSESHARLLLHLRTMSFFDESVIPSALAYVSGFRPLEEDGLKGLTDLIRKELRARKLSLLVLDGLVAAQESAPTSRELKKFVHELQLLAGLTNCTMFLLTSGTPTASTPPEQTMVDGIVELGERVHERRAERSLVVRKFRGSDFLGGRHTLAIGDGGITVYPRIESLYGRPTQEDPELAHRISVGVPKLDAMMGGGIPGGTTTMVLGPSGSGKTTLALAFLNVSTPDHRGLFFGFYESPPRLRSKAKSLGMDIETLEKRGDAFIVWQPPIETNADVLGNRLLEAVKRTGARRVVIDGLDGLYQAAERVERVSHLFTAIANELRIAGATTLYTCESQQLLGAEMTAPVAGISTVMENLLVLRFHEVRSRQFRTMSVLKVRDSDHEMASRLFRITGQGLDIDDDPSAAEALLAGDSHRKAGPDEEHPIVKARSV